MSGAPSQILPSGPQLAGGGLTAGGAPLSALTDPRAVEGGSDLMRLTVASRAVLGSVSACPVDLTDLDADYFCPTCGRTFMPGKVAA